MHIGKEANRFEERLTGLFFSEDDFLLKLGDDGSWPHLVIPALNTFERKRVVEESAIAPAPTLTSSPPGRDRSNGMSGSSGESLTSCLGSG
jgi:hypothetical protein